MPMPEPPVTWERVKERVASMLQTTAGNLNSQWDGLCAQSTRDAANDVATILAGKGYTAAQIAAADQFPYWVELLGAVIALRRGSALARYPQESLDKLDPTERIEKLGVILVGGAATAPSAGATDVGGINSGLMSLGGFQDTDTGELADERDLFA